MSASKSSILCIAASFAFAWLADLRGESALAVMLGLAGLASFLLGVTTFIGILSDAVLKDRK